MGTDMNKTVRPAPRKETRKKEERRCREGRVQEPESKQYLIPPTLPSLHPNPNRVGCRCVSSLWIYDNVPPIHCSSLCRRIASWGGTEGGREGIRHMCPVSRSVGRSVGRN